MAVCANHPKRERVATCGTCEAALCRDCVVHTGVGIKCRTCTGEKQPGTGRRADTGGRRERPRWIVPAAIAGVVALLLGFLVLRSGGDSRPQAEGDLPNENPERSSEFVRERKIDLTGGGGTRIGAFLTLPARGIDVVGAAVIVPGFGAIDHDAVMATTTPDGAADRLSQDLNYSRPGTADNLFRDVNDALLAAGLATLRYDKRGSGTSQLAADKPLSYDDLVADAKAGLDFLSQRRETEGKPLAVVGHDQGGLIAMRLAADPRVRSLLLLSTFGRPLADVIGDDLVAGRGEAVGMPQSVQLHEVADKLAAGQPLPPQQELHGNLRALLRPNQEAYLRTVFGLDPLAEARSVRQPVLLVRGGRDTTVTAVDSERLKGALPAGTEEIVIADADHNLGVRTVRDPVLMSQLGSWLARRVAG